VEHYVTSLVHALPDIVWTALPDGNLDFLESALYDYTALVVTFRLARVGRLPSTGRLAEQLDGWRAFCSGERGDVEARIRRFDGV